VARTHQGYDPRIAGHLGDSPRGDDSCAPDAAYHQQPDTQAEACEAIPTLRQAGKTMRYYFLKMLIAFMRYDITLTKERMMECKMLIDHDEKRLHELQMELLSLENE